MIRAKELENSWRRTLSRQSQSYGTYLRTATLEVLIKIIRESGPEQRHFVAMACNSSDLLEELARDPYELVRLSVARNTDTPQKILADLALNRIEPPKYRMEEGLENGIAQVPWEAAGNKAA